MNVLGYGGANLDPTASLADKEQALEKNTQDHLEYLYDMKKELSKEQRAGDEKRKQERAERLKVPATAGVLTAEVASVPLEEALTEQEKSGLALLYASYAEIQNYIKDHEHELATTLHSADWLKMYSKSIKEHGLDMDALIRDTQDPARYMESLERGESQLQALQSRLGTDETMNWNTLADYSAYIGNLFEASASLSKDKNAYEHFNAIIDFMASHDHSS